MWHFTCSACGEKFWDAQRFTAEEKFRRHAEESHRPRAVLTVVAEDHEVGRGQR